MRALRIQLAAVKQHFIHVLVLGARGDQEGVAAITQIDSVDLANAMQLSDRLVQAGSKIDLCRSQKELMETLPAPGFSDRDIAQSEVSLERDLSAAFEKGVSAPADYEDDIVEELLQSTLGSRRDYQAWLARWVEASASADEPAIPLTERQRDAIDLLFAHLMVMIDQAMVHSFVQLHAGEPLRADTTWEIGGGAMMKATALTNALAKRRLAACPNRMLTMTQASVPIQAISTDPKEAFQADRSLATRCADTARDARATLVGTEFCDIAAGTQNYFEAVILWEPGSSLPDIPNPCRDFGRTRDLYVSVGPQRSQGIRSAG